MDSQKPSAEIARAPRTRNRLLGWFGIYFVPQLLLIPLVLASTGSSSRWLWFLFPTGMAWWLLMLTAWLDDAIGRISSVEAEYYVIALMVVPWIVYIAHFIYSVRVQRRRTFLILMWVLGAIVFFNLGSCASFLHDPPQ